MARNKWKFILLNIICLVQVLVESLPIDKRLFSLKSEPVFNDSDVLVVSKIKNRFLPSKSEDLKTTLASFRSKDTKLKNTARKTISQLRPGQTIRQYALEIAFNGDTFNARAVLDIVVTLETMDDPITLSIENLNIESVLAGVYSESNAVVAEFDTDDDLLKITPAQLASSYIVIINYSGSLTVAGQGLYRGGYNNLNYLAMNLYPTNARRVFPCMDELTQPSLISFTFNNVNYKHIVMNSVPVTNKPNEFMALQGPPLLWTMVAHDLININVPVTDVLLYIRPGVTNQESQASIAINYFFENLNEWTNMPYFGIVLNQNPQLQILALPDVSRDWYGLSSVALWEPYILMENSCSIKQRFSSFSKISEALARQWFGYVIYSENFRFQWITSGLTSYAGFDVLREFQTDTFGTNVNDMLDINTLFVTEVIQESLLRDGYVHATVMEPDENLYTENVIRDHLNGIVKYKAPAILRMLRLILGGPNNDFVQLAGRALIAGRSFDTVNTMQFIDVINGVWSQNGLIDNIGEYLTPFIQNNGYPVLRVQLQQGGVLLSLERFRYQQTSSSDYMIPLTYTVSNAPNYEDTIYPATMLQGTGTLSLPFEEESDDDYVIFNIQGQGYYRVDYDDLLWDRIINALRDPTRRVEIHPLNRATLLDDVLNLARGGRVDYETAFLVALTWEHETEYAPWKAFVRNMNFLRKRLVAMVTEDENLEQDIYLRMVQKTLAAFEADIGFSPDPQINEPTLKSLTRGIVMDHACRANYQPCVAAAIDWFYDPNSSDLVVNPNIPKDIRPAVFCTMVREGDNDVITALNARLEIEPSMWERVVIMESFACSKNTNYINSLLMETIAPNSRFTTEERVKVFIAVAESSFENAQAALEFLNLQAIAVRDMYGGDEKLEEAIHAVGENMASRAVTERFINFVNSQVNSQHDAQFTANRAAQIATENWTWENRHLEYVYLWIAENDAPSLMVSFTLIVVSCLVTLLSQ